MSLNTTYMKKNQDEPRIVTTSIEHSPTTEQNGVVFSAHSSSKSMEQYVEKSTPPDFVKNGSVGGGRTKINYKSNAGLNVTFKNNSQFSNVEQRVCRYGCEKHCRYANTILELIMEMQFVLAAVQFADKIYKRLKTMSPLVASLLLFVTNLSTNFLNFFGPGLLYFTEFLVTKFVDVFEDVLVLSFLPAQKMMECAIVYTRFWFRPLLKILCTHNVSSISNSNCACNCECDKTDCNCGNVKLLSGVNRQ